MSCPGVPLALPAPCLPSQHPSPAAPAPQNATSSAAGCLKSEGGHQVVQMAALLVPPALPGQHGTCLVPAPRMGRVPPGRVPPGRVPPGTSPHQSLSQEAWEGVAGLGGGVCSRPSTAPSCRPPPRCAPSSWITRKTASARMVPLSATSRAASTMPASHVPPGGTGSSRCT